jgi:hypothetical protein
VIGGDHLLSRRQYNLESFLDAGKATIRQNLSKIVTGTGSLKREILVIAVLRVWGCFVFRESEFPIENSSREDPQSGAFCKRQIRHGPNTLAGRTVNSSRANVWISGFEPCQIGNDDRALHFKVIIAFSSEWFPFP